LRGAVGMGEVEAAALAFFRDAGSAKSLDKLVQGFAAMVEPMGYSSAACFHMGRPGEPIWVRLAFSWNLPDAVLTRIKRRLSADDQAIRAAMMSLDPCAWEAFEAAEDGLRGWLVPVQGPLGETVCVTVTGEPASPPGDRERMMIQVATSLLASHGVALAEIEVEASDDRLPTTRENECGYWAGRGKSDWQIGQILDLSEGAVAYHLNSLARKLRLKGRGDIPRLFRRISLPSTDGR
jgi:DNA-binding CsgD family transcriptional regulator